MQIHACNASSPTMSAACLPEPGIQANALLQNALRTATADQSQSRRGALEFMSVRALGTARKLPRFPPQLWGATVCRIMEGVMSAKERRSAMEAAGIAPKRGCGTGLTPCCGCHEVVPVLTMYTIATVNA